jgi:hypothetical protein
MKLKEIFLSFIKGMLLKIQDLTKNNVVFN